MQMLSEQFEMSDEEAKNVKTMATFIALFHTKAFLQSRLATISPAVYLKYVSMMSLYRKENEIAASTAIKSILNHLWYLSEELVVFSVFDRELTESLRKALVEKLLSIPRPKRFLPGKPKFPKIGPNDSVEYPDQLIRFIGPNSWLLFDLLKMNEEQLDWMQAPVSCWEKISGYKKAEAVVRSMEVVNDCAERAVKLITDFKDVVGNVEEQNYLFQVVEQHRAHFKSFKKSSLNLI